MTALAAGWHHGTMAGEVTDITIEILKQIRDGITELRVEFKGELKELREEVKELREEVEQSNVRLERVESGLRDLGQFMRSLALEMTEYKTFHAHHVELIEQSMQDLRGRVGRLEDRASAQ